MQNDTQWKEELISSTKSPSRLRSGWDSFFPFRRYLFEKISLKRLFQLILTIYLSSTFWLLLFANYHQSLSNDNNYYNKNKNIISNTNGKDSPLVWNNMNMNNNMNNNNINNHNDKTIHVKFHNHIIPHPRQVGYYFTQKIRNQNQNETKTQTKTRFDLLLGYEKLPYDLRRIHVGARRPGAVSQFYTLRDIKMHYFLIDEEEYADRLADPLERDDDHCSLKYDWQRHHYPTCNLFHEINLQPHLNAVKILTHGYWRDVWLLLYFKSSFSSTSTSTSSSTSSSHSYSHHSSSAKVIMKTLRYEHIWEDRNFERHRRDAIASERLTSSQYVMNIYGHCGNSALFDYSQDGDLHQYFEGSHQNTKISPAQKLYAAYQVASGIADMHGTDIDEDSGIAHTDITPYQFLLINGTFQLNDFNRCRFLTKHKETNKTCPFHVGNNPGRLRSPEEYRGDDETEKVDIYSMGNIFYLLLTGFLPYDLDGKDSTVQNKVMQHDTPRIQDSSIINSTDIAIISLREAMKRCWRYEPQDRPTARQVANDLFAVLAKISNKDTP